MPLPSPADFGYRNPVTEAAAQDLAVTVYAALVRAQVEQAARDDMLAIRRRWCPIAEAEAIRAAGKWIRP